MLPTNQPRFRRQTVLGENLGFGGGFGYCNNTTYMLKDAINQLHTVQQCSMLFIDHILHGYQCC